MHSSDQDTRSIRERFSDAVFGLNYEEVESLVGQLEQVEDDKGQIIRDALKKVDKAEFRKKSRESKSKLVRIRGFLTEELKRIDAKVTVLPLVSSVGEDIAATTSAKLVDIDDERQVSNQLSPQVELQVENGSEFEENKDDRRDSPLNGSANCDEQRIEIFSYSLNVPTSGESANNCSSGECVEVFPFSGFDGSSSKIVDNEDDIGNLQTVPLVKKMEQASVLLVSEEPGTVLPELIPLTPGSETIAPKPNPLLSSLSKEDDAQGNSRRTCTTDKGGLAALRGIKAGSGRPVVAASALSVIGIVLGVAIASYLQMLAAGIVVSACYLVAATFVYCYAPNSSIENSEVEELSNRSVVIYV